MNLKPLKSAALTAYKRSYLKKEQPDGYIEVFRQVQAHFGNIDDKVLYPGCHRHLSASLVWPKVDYVDSDDKVADVYKDPACREWVQQNAHYRIGDDAEPTHIPDYSFTCADFTRPLPTDKFTVDTYDCIISLSAGIISTPCVPYLVPGKGILVVNDSHSDAKTAFLDDRLELVGGIVGDLSGGKVEVVTCPKQINRYFHTTTGSIITSAMVEESIRVGSVARRSFRLLDEAFVYVFRRCGGNDDNLQKEECCSTKSVDLNASSGGKRDQTNDGESTPGTKRSKRSRK